MRISTNLENVSDDILSLIGTHIGKVANIIVSIRLLLLLDFEIILFENAYSGGNLTLAKSGYDVEILRKSKKFLEK